MYNLISFVRLKPLVLPISTSVLCALVLSLGAQNAGAQVQLSPALDVPSASQKIAPGGEKMLINTHYNMLITNHY